MLESYCTLLWKVAHDLNKYFSLDSAKEAQDIFPLEKVLKIQLVVLIKLL
jgi:hypothetical protein